VDISKQMDDIYRNLPPDRIPWNIAEPPALLVEAVRTGKIKPCKVVDLGCGAGNYAVWLAGQGFDVTGLDISSEAVKLAREQASKAGFDCRFDVVDLLGDLPDYEATFDLAIDWELLHHIFPEDREHLVKNVHSMLQPKGVFFSLCFSVEDPAFGGKGKFRDTNIGTRLYFSSERELQELFSPLFEVLDLRTVEIEGKYGPHAVNAAWLQRK